MKEEELLKSDAFAPTKTICNGIFRNEMRCLLFYASRRLIRMEGTGKVQSETFKFIAGGISV